MTGLSDMFEHPDADDPVIAARDLSPVRGVQRQAVADASPFRFRANELALLPARRYPHAVNAIVLDRVKQQGAPATAHIQQRLLGLQPELTADQLELLRLGLLDVVLRGAEISARIRHRGIKPAAKKDVALIVVVAGVPHRLAAEDR